MQSEYILIAKITLEALQAMDVYHIKCVLIF